MYYPQQVTSLSVLHRFCPCLPIISDVVVRTMQDLTQSILESGGLWPDVQRRRLWTQQRIALEGGDNVFGC